jgi:hypothetical protein
LLGGLAAATSTYLFFYLRKNLVETTGLPDTTFGLLEDSLALSGGYLVAKG